MFVGRQYDWIASIAVILALASLSHAVMADEAVRGVALTIGLNRIDPNHYGSDGALFACENDARDMADIARAQGFKVNMLLTRAATREAVTKALASAAEQLKAGDIFMVSYSGHGGQVHDFNGDEKDNDPGDTLDETWCLFDAQLIDDELAVAWGRFPKDVRILLFSDSCHSGTVAKGAKYRRFAGTGIRLTPGHRAVMGWKASGRSEKARGDLSAMYKHFLASPEKPWGPREKPSTPGFRNLPVDVAFNAFVRNVEFYERVGKKPKQRDRAPIDASVLLISGCQDNQLSADGWVNGLFTGTLKAVWAQGAFTGDYRAFHQTILMRMPSDQSPNFYRVGALNDEFERQRPFTVK